MLILVITSDFYYFYEKQKSLQDSFSCFSTNNVNNVGHRRETLITLNDDKNFLRRALVLSCFDNRAFAALLRFLVEHKGDNRSVINRKEVNEAVFIHKNETIDILLLSVAPCSIAYINDNLDKKLFFCIRLIPPHGHC